MTLQSSGPLKASEIQAEFGGASPFRLSDYYAGGANVPEGTVGDGGPIPSSGTIKFSDFYGASDLPPSTLAQVQGAVLVDSVSDPSDARVGYHLTSGGQEESLINADPYTLIDQWLLSGGPTSYECRLTVNSGTAPSGSATGVWLLLNITREWELSRTTVGVSTNSCTIEVRLTAGAVQDAATVTMEAEVT